MIAPTARARAAALTGAVVGAAAVASLLGSGTSTAASPPPLRTYGPPTTWTAPVPVTASASTGRWLSVAGTSGLLGVGGVPVALSRPPAAAPGPTPSATARPAGPPAGVGPDSPLAQVRALQRLLNARLGAGAHRSGAHGPALRVDGDWGPATTRAVRRFQAQVGLPVDGQAGPATLAALRNPS